MAAAGSAHDAGATPGAPSDADARLKLVGESAGDAEARGLRLLPE